MYSTFSLRFFLSTFVFFIYFLIKKRKITVTKNDIKLFIVLGGVLYTLQSIFHFGSLEYISSSMAVLILFSFPIFVCFVSFIVYKETLNLRATLSLLVSFISLIFLLGVSFHKMNLQGIILALLSAVVYAFYMIVGEKTTNQNSPIVTSAFVTLFAAIGVLIPGMIKHNIGFNFNIYAWIHILCIVFVSTILAEIALFKSLKLLSPSLVSIISMIEPLFTTVFAYLFLKETLGLSQILGGILTLVTLILLVYFQNKSISHPQKDPNQKERYI
ncbi:DMT family transporter [Terrilactibacillus sp. S3-3]|nr:DMT family transporter [Terrilactibacillus sp. S3-3]